MGRPPAGGASVSSTCNLLVPLPCAAARRNFEFWHSLAKTTRPQQTEVESASR